MFDERRDGSCKARARALQGIAPCLASGVPRQTDFEPPHVSLRRSVMAAGRGPQRSGFDGRLVGFGWRKAEAGFLKFVAGPDRKSRRHLHTLLVGCPVRNRRSFQNGRSLGRPGNRPLGQSDQIAAFRLRQGQPRCANVRAMVTRRP